MVNTSSSELVKLMVDEKVEKILFATKSKDGLNSTEISKATGIPKTQLYYTLNKMVSTDLLEIVKEKKVRNLIEYYYSSYSFTHFDSLISKELNDDVGRLSNISTSWAIEHLDELIQWIVYRDQQFIKVLDEELSSKKAANPINSYPSFYNTTLHLTMEDEAELWKDIMKLISSFQKKNKDPNANKINFFIKKW